MEGERGLKVIIKLHILTVVFFFFFSSVSDSMAEWERGKPVQEKVSYHSIVTSTTKSCTGTLSHQTYTNNDT